MSKHRPWIFPDSFCLVPWVLHLLWGTLEFRACKLFSLYIFVTPFLLTSSPFHSTLSTLSTTEKNTSYLLTSTCRVRSKNINFNSRIHTNFRTFYFPKSFLALLFTDYWLHYLLIYLFIQFPMSRSITLHLKNKNKMTKLGWEIKG